MHMYEVGEAVDRGLLLQREPYPHISSPPNADRRFLLAKNVSDAASRIPRAMPGQLRLEFADLEFGNGVLLFKRDSFGRRSRRKTSALVRVCVAGGDGGVARLLANCFNEKPLRKGVDEIGRQYFPFPSAGVHPFCTKEHVEQVKNGLEFLDVMMLLQPGAGFRIHRTGDLRDQYGERASSQIAVRWTGYALVPRYYDDRVPVSTLLEATLEAAAE